MRLNKTNISFTLIILIIVSVSNLSAQVKRTKKFYIKHETSGKYLHPSGGYAGKGVDLVLFDGVKEEASFYIEYADEGNWGYLVSSSKPSLSIHPRGSSINSGDGSLLSFWTGKLLGSQFRINPETKTIEHKSGRYWHPSGGSDMPGNGTKLVIFKTYNPNTKFIAVNRNGKEVDLQLPTKVSTRWKKVSSKENNTQLSINITGEYSVGTFNRTTTTNEKESTISAGMEGSMFGIGLSASAEFRNLFSETKESAKDETKKTTEKYELGPGQSLVLWQQELVSTHFNRKETTLSTPNIKWEKVGVNPNN
ncbi:MAG: hypothetical protein COA67_00820 [Lutibacter sp.]|nr:MAG: hypothetical protein COA67_00820 [Lutibacter sp.]